MYIFIAFVVIYIIVLAYLIYTTDYTIAKPVVTPKTTGTVESYTLTPYPHTYSNLHGIHSIEHYTPDDTDNKELEQYRKDIADKWKREMVSMENGLGQLEIKILDQYGPYHEMGKLLENETERRNSLLEEIKSKPGIIKDTLGVIVNNPRIAIYIINPTIKIRSQDYPDKEVPYTNWMSMIVDINSKVMKYLDSIIKPKDRSYSGLGIVPFLDPDNMTISSLSRQLNDKHNYYTRILHETIEPSILDLRKLLNDNSGDLSNVREFANNLNIGIIDFMTSVTEFWNIIGNIIKHIFNIQSIYTPIELIHHLTTDKTSNRKEIIDIVNNPDATIFDMRDKLINLLVEEAKKYPGTKNHISILMGTIHGPINNYLREVLNPKLEQI